MPVTLKFAELLQNASFLKTKIDLQKILDFFGNFFFRRRKMKCSKSSETRFPKVSRRSEPSSRGKRPFEVSKKIRFFVYTVVYTVVYTEVVYTGFIR